MLGEYCPVICKSCYHVFVSGAVLSHVDTVFNVLYLYDVDRY